MKGVRFLPSLQGTTETQAIICTVREEVNKTQVNITKETDQTQERSPIQQWNKM